MDYKKRLDAVKKNYDESEQLRKRIAENERQTISLLETTLDEMANELENRNAVYTQLTKDEQQIIVYVESGKYEENVKHMPSTIRESHKKTIDEIYSNAKRKIGNQGSKLVGYLTARGGDDAVQITVKTPIKAKLKDKTESLTEMLYEHHVNVGNFEGEVEDNGYVAFTLNSKRDEVKSRINDITTRLSNDLPSGLKVRGVSYEVVDLDALRESKIGEEKIDVTERASTEAVVKPKVIGTAKDVTVKEATKILGYHKSTIYRMIENGRLQCADNGKISADSINKVIGGCESAPEISRRSIEQISEDIRVQDAMDLLDMNEKAIGYHFYKRHLVKSKPGFISASSFNDFIRDYYKKTERWVRRSMNNLDEAGESSKKDFEKKEKSMGYSKSSIEQIAEEVDVKEAAKILGINRTSVYDHINGGRLIKTKSGFVSGESLDSFMNVKYEKRGGRWLPRKSFGGALEERDKKETGREIPVSEAATILDIDESQVYRCIQKGDLIKTRRSFVDGDSVKSFQRDNIKVGGENRTIYLPRFGETRGTVTMIEAERRLDVSRGYLKTLIDRDDIKQLPDRTITVKSIDEFRKRKNKRGGKKKTIYLDRGK